METPQHEKEPKFVDLFDPDMAAKLSEARTYKRKIEPIRGARQVRDAEVVESRLPDGTLESTVEARPGDWVITGAKGEEFVFTNAKFESLYEVVEGVGYVPRERRVKALPNAFGRTVRIAAPWGTPEQPAFQEGSAKAFFVAELTPDGTLTADRYIIGDEELLLSNYEPMEQ